MLHLVFISSLLICSGLAAAQTTFSTEYHGGTGDEAVDAVEDASGNLVVLGYVFSASNSDVVLSLMSPSGVLQQTYTYPTGEYEIPKSITSTSDGGYFITGSVFTNPSDYDLLLIKLDSTFNTVFRQRYSAGGNEYGNHGFEVAPGLYGVAGSMGLGGSARPSYVIVDDNGDIRHEAYLNTNQFASPDFSGRYMGSGVTALVHLTNAFTLLDSSGTVIGSCPTNIGLFTTDVLRTLTGGYACIAASDYGAPLGGSLTLGIIDSNLSSWTTGFKVRINAHELLPVAMEQDGSGNIYIAANATSLSSGNTFPLLIKADPGGNLLWSKSYNPPGSPGAAFRHLRITADGGILLCGSSGPWNNQRLYVTKVDTAGTAPCNWTPYPLAPLPISSIGQTQHAPYSGTMPPPLVLTGNSVLLSLTTDALCNGGGTGIGETLPSTSLVHIRPTLFREYFSIESERGGVCEIEVFSSVGGRMNRFRAEIGEPVPAGSWPAGLYTFRVRLLSGETVILRAIHER